MGRPSQHALCNYRRSDCWVPRLPWPGEHPAQQQQQQQQQQQHEINGGSSIETPHKMSEIASPLTIDSYRRNRAVVSMGRNLLRQMQETDDVLSVASHDGSTTSNGSYLTTLKRRTADKRQRLRDSMTRNNNEDVTGREVVCIQTLDSNHKNSLDGTGDGFIATIKSVTNVIKKSGKKLKLGGRWFNYPKTSSIKAKRREQLDNDYLDFEFLANNYCRSVEALVLKQQEEVKELKQFCGFLEKRL